MDRERSGGRPEEDVLTEARPKTRVPPRYRVLFHNDDFTTMDFVVEALVRFFQKTPTEATRIMLEVHLRGRGVAGSYTRDVAETRVARVTAAAQEQGFPLLVTMEPE
jgi:ATP-dependent Clp protease adaptor protein ClpS